MRGKSTGNITIANNASLSGPLDLSNKVLCAIIMSAAWTAACLTFQASDDQGATWYELTDALGNAVSVVVAGVIAGGRISVDPSDFAGVDFIKVRSGTVGAAVAQGAARTLTLVSRKYYALD
jgi:hypothetical protein